MADQPMNQRLTGLRALLNDAAHAYYVLDAPQNVEQLSRLCSLMTIGQSMES